jgi:hypothetical protein
MMTNIFQKLVPGGLLYIRIKRDWLSVRDVKTGHCYEDIPVAALSAGEDGSVLAVGFAAHNLQDEAAEYTIVNGFEDPRMIIANAGVAEYTLRYFMDSVVKKGLLQPPLKVILHPTEFGRGKLSRRAALALQQLAIRAGAAEAYVWVGMEPMKSEITGGDFPTRGEWLTEAPGWAKHGIQNQ